MKLRAFYDELRIQYHNSISIDSFSLVSIENGLAQLSTDEDFSQHRGGFERRLSRADEVDFVAIGAAEAIAGG
jgi:hypothetical protein